MIDQLVLEGVLDERKAGTGRTGPETYSLLLPFGGDEAGTK